MTAHIWACPPSEGDDYIFHCHPPEQKIPKPKRLVEWYRKMLDRGKADNVVYDYRVRDNFQLLMRYSITGFEGGFSKFCSIFMRYEKSVCWDDYSFFAYLSKYSMKNANSIYQKN